MACSMEGSKEKRSLCVIDIPLMIGINLLEIINYWESLRINVKQGH